MSVSGSCLCGSVKYASDAVPIVQGNCHCHDCQKSSGSAFLPTLFVAEGSLKITGDVRYYTSQGGSGSDISRGFCPTCGSQLFGKPTVRAGMIGIRAGTLDDTSIYRPMADAFVSHAAPWDHMDHALPKFPAAPVRK